MWDDDYDDYSYERPERYEVRRVYLVAPPREPQFYRRGGKEFRFSPTEIRHLAVAYFVLVVCFAVALSVGFGGILFGLAYPEYFIARVTFMFPISLVAVGLGFILHEVAHKFAAQHYGCWSEFRYDSRGLMMALVFSLIIGFVYAAPGATWFSGHVTRRENGIISLAGPGVNMSIAAIFIIACFVIPLDSIMWWSAGYIGFIIAFLAVFNLLPINPLDGSKVVQWNIGIYILVFAVSIIMVGFFYIALFTTLIFV